MSQTMRPPPLVCRFDTVCVFLAARGVRGYSDAELAALADGYDWDFKSHRCPTWAPRA